MINARKYQDKNMEVRMGRRFTPTQAIASKDNIWRNKTDKQRRQTKVETNSKRSEIKRDSTEET